MATSHTPMEQSGDPWPATTANEATSCLLLLPESVGLTGSGVLAQPTAHKVGYSLCYTEICLYVAMKQAQDHSTLDLLYTAVDCMDPPALTSGTVDTSRGTTYQSVAVYQCDEGYTLQGQAITACLDNGTWSGPTPTCAREWPTELRRLGVLGRLLTPHDYNSIEVRGCHSLTLQQLLFILPFHPLPSLLPSLSSSSGRLWCPG